MRLTRVAAFDQRDVRARRGVRREARHARIGVTVGGQLEVATVTARADIPIGRVDEDRSMTITNASPVVTAAGTVAQLDTSEAPADNWKPCAKPGNVTSTGVTAVSAPEVRMPKAK